jgi:hypothetical protein
MRWDMINIDLLCIKIITIETRITNNVDFIVKDI